jgi:hypothetical protein
MTDRHQTETATYSKNFHHSSRSIAEYYRDTSDKAGLQSFNPPAVPLILPLCTFLAHLLCKSIAIRN